MKEIFSFNKFGNGSFIDHVSGEQGVFTKGNSKGFVETEKGLALDGAHATLVTYEPKTVKGGDSVIFHIMPTSFLNYPTFIGSDSASNFIRFSTGGTLQLSANGDTINFSSVFQLGVYVFIEIRFNGSEIELYKNNILMETYLWNSSSTLTFTTLSEVFSSRYFIGYLNRVLIVSNINTEKRNQLYQQFLQASPRTYPRDQFSKPLVNDLSHLVDNQLGDDIVVGGNPFDAANWNEEIYSGVNVINGKMVYDGSGDSIIEVRQLNNSVVANMNYLITYEIEDYNQGTHRVIIGALDKTTQKTGNGVFTSKVFNSDTTYSPRLCLRTENNFIGKYKWIKIYQYSGTIAAYNQVGPNEIVTDITGNGKDGIATGVTMVEGGMWFYGKKSVVELGTPIVLLGDFTIHLRVSNITNYVIGATTDTNYILITPLSTRIRGGISYTSSMSNPLLSRENTISISRVGDLISVFTNGVFIISESIEIGDLELNLFAQRISGQYFTMILLKDIRFLNYAITPQEAQAYHDSFKTPELIEHFQNNAVGDTLPEGWSKSGGNGEIIEETDKGFRPELVVNGGFDTWAGLPQPSDYPTGWLVIYNNTENYVENYNGCRFIGKLLTLRIRQVILTIGKTYKFIYKITESNSGSLRLVYPAIVLESEVGVYSVDFTATGIYFDIGSNSTLLDITIDNVSLKQIPQLPQLPLGAKKWKQLTAGIISTPSTWSHGVMWVGINKVSDGNTTFINVIANIANVTSGIPGGYDLRINVDESIKLVRTAEAVLFTTAPSYILPNTNYLFKIVRLQSEGVFKDIPTLQTSDLVSTPYSYTEFTSNGRYGFHAINDGSSTKICGTVQEIDIIAGEKFLIEFDLKLNSGVLPKILFSSAQGSASVSYTCVDGRNSQVVTITTTRFSAVLGFWSYSGDETDYQISGLTIRKYYPANTFASFIQGGEFQKLTLVDTTGGSGSNPITDSTYLESSHIVADLDAGDTLFCIDKYNQQ